MNLNLLNKKYIICGATGGFGLAITKALVNEGAEVIAIARNEEHLKNLKNQFPDKITVYAGDITNEDIINGLFVFCKDKTISGILINAGGPPAKLFMETNLKDWDDAYKLLIRWKIHLTKMFIPLFEKNNFGRFLYIESAAVKQPIENLILSTSMRLAIVGFVKTISQEISDKQITFNILAPGYHRTKAIERLVKKKCEMEKSTFEEGLKKLEKNLPMGKLGLPDDFAPLALFLLSQHSQYITGQVYAVDGGLIKSTL